MKAVYACVLIIIGTLLTTGFLGYEHGAESNIVQTTSAQGKIPEAFNQTPLTPDYPVNLDNTNSSQIVNNQDSPQNITLTAETSNSQTIVPSELDNVAERINIGVNYLSTYNMYSSNYTTDEVLNRDFSRFKSDGINIIILALYWNRLEGNTRGDYNGQYLPDSRGVTVIYGDRFLDNIKHVIGIAQNYGIGVMLTIHTVWENGSAAVIPDYVVDPTTGRKDSFAIVRNEDMKKAFVDMFNHTVSYLAGTPNIIAWAVLNEPWYYHELDTPKGALNQKENFIDIIQKLSIIVKTIDGRPVTIRFVNSHNKIDVNGVPGVTNIFQSDWNFDQRILDAVDFISLNDYMPAYPEVYSAWKNITINNIMKLQALGKSVWITECGFPPSRFDSIQGANDDTVQAEQYHEFIKFYNTLPVRTIIAWYWRGDNNIPSPGTPGYGRNLCENLLGDPRPAYFELVNKTLT